MGSSHQHGNGRNVALPDDNRPTWRPDEQRRDRDYRGARDDGEFRAGDQRDEHWAPHAPRDTGYRAGSATSEPMGYRAGGNLPQPSDNWSHPQGWRGGHRGKGPVGYTRSDERIREAACEALTDDDQVDATDIEVVVHDGEVTLSGIADDRHAKRLAEDCIWRVTGVRDVQNQLRLRASRGNPSSASAVTKDERAEPKGDRKPRA